DARCLHPGHGVRCGRDRGAVSARHFELIRVGAMKGCTLRQVPRQTRLRQRALCIALLFAPGTPFASLLAQEPSPDKAAALANIEGACPRDWEPMDAGFMGDRATASDPWRGSIA